MGFDHIYMWYRPEMNKVPRFAELQSLPYVTLTINTQGNVKNYYAQWKTEEMCLKDKAFAGKHDWAMINDIDEYLWFPENMGIKQFLARQPSHYTYLSFPKRMYTLDHWTDVQAFNHKIDMSTQDHFAVSKYPFYLDNFCYHVGGNRGNPYCPRWTGRAKLIVRPQNHTKIDVHGTIHKPNPAEGQIHFSPDVAKFLEWPYIFAKHNVTRRDAVDFLIQTEEQVHIHNLVRGFKADKDGNFRMQYDDKLEDWFRYVESRFEAGP
jgi:hypothetical protein